MLKPDKPKDFQPPEINSFTVNDNTVTLNNTQTTQTVTFTVNITDNVNVIFIVYLMPHLTEKKEIIIFLQNFFFNDYDFGDTTNTFTV